MELAYEFEPEDLRTPLRSLTINRCINCGRTMDSYGTLVACRSCGAQYDDFI